MIVQDFGGGAIIVLFVAATLIGSGLLFTVWSRGASQAASRADAAFRRFERRPSRKTAPISPASAGASTPAARWRPAPAQKARLMTRPNPRHLKALRLTSFEAEDADRIDRQYEERRAAVEAELATLDQGTGDAGRLRDDLRLLAEARKFLGERLGDTSRAR